MEILVPSEMPWHLSSSFAIRVALPAASFAGDRGRAWGSSAKRQITGVIPSSATVTACQTLLFVFFLYL